MDSLIPFIELSNQQITASIDPGRGGDVLSLIDNRSGIDVLFRTPWRERADSIRSGHSASSYDPVAGWIERYRGGWQTLCPNAGNPRSLYGGPVGFHGEAASVVWAVDEVTPSQARLHVELFSIPLRIERTVELDGPTIRITDHLSNLSAGQIEFDYSQHPAFGGPFLDGECRIETGASRFVSDPESASLIPSGAVHDWPFARTGEGHTLDMRELAGPDSSRVIFGWLEGFSEHWASITRADLGLTVRIQWDGRQLPYAWVWQELNGSVGFPWYGRARVIAIEPASTQTSGPERISVLRLGPRTSEQISVSVSLENRRT